MTKDIMKKARATIPSDSFQLRPDIYVSKIVYCVKDMEDIPIAIMPDANCHDAALNASEIQYAIIDVTPHFLSCLGTGSKSLFVLFTISCLFPIQPSTLQQYNSPSCIPLCKSTLRLINLEMRSFERNHRVSDVLHTGPKLGVQIHNKAGPHSFDMRGNQRF
jgi:hypothetical protein